MNDSNKLDKIVVSRVSESVAPDDGVRPSSGSEATLPCLYSNISIEIPFKSTSHKRSASALSWNVQHFSEKFGLKNIGFLTLTFRDHILCHKQAQKRLNSLLSNVIVPRYGDYVGVVERQKSGRIHYHLLVNVGVDIRSGVQFGEIANTNYSSAPKALRDEWAFWRKTAPKYRFGRTELMPVKSTSEAIGRYVGKYIAKHMEVRHESDKNARLVRYSKGSKIATTRFMYLSEGSSLWREKVSVFAHMVASSHGCEPTFEGLRSILGPRWAYNHREIISNIPVQRSD